MGMQRRSAHGQGAHRLRLLIAALAAAQLVTIGATSASASAASSTACRVQNQDTGKTFTVLQDAVDAAKRGDHLIVHGTCHGRTVIDRDLLIAGSTGAGRSPTLAVCGRGYGLLVRVATTVHVLGIRIESSHAPSCPQEVTRGIRNIGNLTLSDVRLRRLYRAIHNQAALRLDGATVIEGNREGVFNQGEMTMDDTSRISRNGCQSCWPTPTESIAVINAGTLTMNGASRISNNGRSVQNSGTMTMNGTSLISRNASGINNTGSLTLNDASSIRLHSLPQAVCGDSGSSGFFCPQQSGAGVWNYGSLTLNDSSAIRGNAAGRRGGGVDMPPSAQRPSLTMTGSSGIFGNTAAESGGGIWYSVANATLVGVICGPGGNVYGNSPDDCYIE